MKGAQGHPETPIQPHAQPDLRVVVFKMAGHEYVVNAASVQEIVRPVESSIGLGMSLTPVDGAPEYVEGVVKWREHIVPIVDLRKYLGLEAKPLTVESCVLISKLSIGLVGFIVDSASELMRIKADAFQAPSPVIAGIDPTLSSTHFEGLAHLDERLFVLLNLERLLTPEEQGALTELESEESPSPGKGEGTKATSAGPAPTKGQSLVAFELGDELYGVPIASVAEIREPQALTPLPNVPAHVLGLINVRGVVLPVVDLREKFELDPQPDGPENRLIVLKGPGYPVALWVDRVHSLARLSPSDFQPAPSGVAQINPEYYEQVVRLNGRMLIELNAQKLLTDTERDPSGDQELDLS